MQAFDALGILLDSTNAPQISSSTNVPPQTYTPSPTGALPALTFNSQGTGLTTFNAMLLDNFVLTTGNSADLPPSVLHYQSSEWAGIICTPAAIPHQRRDGGPGLGAVTGVALATTATLWQVRPNPVRSPLWGLFRPTALMP